MNLKLKRHPKNPILEPTTNWWENKAVFNPGATIYNGKIILLYRAMGDDNISRLGYAQSDDGVNFKRFDLPRYDPPIDDPYERLGAEDTRITKFEDAYYILYTAVSLYDATSQHRKTASISTSKNAPFRIRIGLLTTKNFLKFHHHEIIFPRLDTKNAALFPRKINDYYYIAHRVFPNLTIAKSKDFRRWDHENILTVEELKNYYKLGTGAPPIETKYGWLLFYHFVDNKTRNYHLGLMVLDLNDPSKIVYLHPKPLLSPQEPYERQGNVENVVFTCGAVEWKGHYYVYYGGADKVIGLATVPVKEVMAVVGEKTGGLL